MLLRLFAELLELGFFMASVVVIIASLTLYALIATGLIWAVLVACILIIVYKLGKRS